MIVESVPPSSAACGVCYAHNWQGGGARGYGSRVSADSIAELASIGVTTLSITPFAFTDSLRSTTVGDAEWVGASETRERMAVDIDRAHALGMTVVLKPHLWVRGGAWQGELDPDPAGGGWDALMQSWGDYIVSMAEFAAQHDVEVFVVGTEMKSATRAVPELWRALIARVRAVYRGRLVYAANWDEAEAVAFWDALDAIGVQMYAPLAPQATLDDEVLEQGARVWLDRFVAIADQTNKPLLVTEVGFMNRSGTVVEPHVWPEHFDGDAGANGELEQAAAWRAIFATFGQHPRVEAIYGWKWFTDPLANEEGPVGFAFRGRVAQDVFARACGAP